MGISCYVIPGRAERREPGIHSPGNSCIFETGGLDSGSPLCGVRNDVEQSRGRWMRTLFLVLVTLAAFAATRADAQQYPSRPVTIVVPFAAGGGSDLLARLVAQKLEEKLGKPFIIENRPGAATTLAAMQVVRAAPDGYTLMQATSSTMAINVSMSKKLPYEPLKDLVPVALLSSSPFFLVVSTDSPLKSVG